MKKKYKLLLVLLVIEIYVVSVLNKNNVQIRSLMWNALGTFIFLLPLQILLFMLSGDMQFSERKRKCFKIVFWFINVSYLLGGMLHLFN